MTGHIVIDDIRPATPHGYPAKAVVGEAVPVRAVIFRDGHDILGAEVELSHDLHGPLSTAALGALGNDDWSAVVVPERLGRHHLVVRAWTDRGATWSHKVGVKLEAGQDIDVEIAEGVALVRAALSGRRGLARRTLRSALDALSDATLTPEQRVAPARSADVLAILGRPDLAPDLTTAAALPLWVDRPRALVGAWYELFPRSHGGLAGVAGRLPALAEMGFDVVYLPPVHPIGRSHRKGRNNSLLAGPDDPGSPWAIGSAEGGHTSVHPELGTIDDFDALVDAAAAAGLELALGYALQCSPDHPWVGEHPEWFHRRPDGSIAYAENPPKKYQDIYPINFWPAEEADRAALWDACRDILAFWIGHGIRIFRVDNPHTKPIAFWEWLIPAVQADHPDVVFLAEAFTRPRVMARLAEVGFSQSYTYFTWRTAQHGEEGLRVYVEELAHGPTADYMRPNFWPNTPDILAGPLRDGPPSAFALRAVLAATLAPSYGIYSGYELYENAPASPTNEEYLDSEKYQLRPREFAEPGSLVPLLTSLNRLRRAHPALQQLRGTSFVASDNPQLLAYTRHSDDGRDIVLCVVTLDPVRAQEGLLRLDTVLLGLPDGQPYEVLDELSGETYRWTGADVFVRLEPWARVAHIFSFAASAAPA